MNDCYRCPVSAACYYPFKVCDCNARENLWTAEQRRVYDEWVEMQQAKMRGITSAEYKLLVARMIK